MTTTVQWSIVRTNFECDGSWRDIYVLGTTLKDWSRIAEMIENAGYQLTFQGSWSGSKFPSNISVLFPRNLDSVMTSLTIDVAGVALNCHFFDVSTIEFDLDPRQVTGQSELDTILRSMTQISKALKKLVLLTPENRPESPILTVLPDSNEIIYDHNSPSA